MILPLSHAFVRRHGAGSAQSPGGRRRPGGRSAGRRTQVLVLALTGVLGLLLTTSATATATGTAAVSSPTATGTPLRDGTGLYPRAIRLAHNGAADGRVLASVVTFDGNNGIGAIHESTDSGATFHEVGRIADPESAAGQGLCCTTLFELPGQVGALRAGTLLWASSAGQDETDRRMALRIWRSDDMGANWSYLSSCAVAGGTGGLWEPEFSVAADGALVCHYADETNPAHSQKLVAARSYDGVRWEGHHSTVASGWEPDRPGMPVVRQLPNGTYFMSYEICNPGGQYQCVVHYRTSADGWNWGGPRPAGHPARDRRQPVLPRRSHHRLGTRSGRRVRRAHAAGRTAAAEPGRHARRRQRPYGPDQRAERRRAVVRDRRTGDGAGPGGELLPELQLAAAALGGRQADAADRHRLRRDGVQGVLRDGKPAVARRAGAVGAYAGWRTVRSAPVSTPVVRAS
ncbi:sialidase family protein [Streptomyces sp. S584]|uniref:sialidase family protein n=1 Tax=Streptomyces sp. S584 TaxID=3096010 RepID=UPI002AFE5207|nr:sialidase family protein [Streptomyces sp. S584]